MLTDELLSINFNVTLTRTLMVIMIFMIFITFPGNSSGQRDCLDIISVYGITQRRRPLCRVQIVHLNNFECLQIELIGEYVEYLKYLGDILI